MPAYLPDFLRRFGLLRDARRDLLRGEPDRALERLRDPSLVVSRRAAELRERAVDLLCRAADERAAEGRDRSAARLLDLAEGEDPLRAARWRERVGAQAGDGPSEREGEGRNGSSAHPVGAPGEEAHPDGEQDAKPADPPEDRRRNALSEVLAEMRASTGPEAPSSEDSGPSPPAPRLVGAGGVPSVIRIHLGIDLVGDLLLCVGRRWTLGHQRAGIADLPFLADVPPVGARIDFEGMSFHGGPSWTLVEGAESSLLADSRGDDEFELGGGEGAPGVAGGTEPRVPTTPGRSDSPLGAEGSTAVRRAEEGAEGGLASRPLRDGDILDLAPNLRLRFRCPDPEVSMALLELLDDSECLGAQRILLLAPGPRSTIRVGPSGALRAPIPSGEVELVLEGAEIRFRSTANLRLIGDDLDPRTLEPSPEQRAPFPPTGRLDLLVGQGNPGRPPFGICLRPVEELT